MMINTIRRRVTLAAVALLAFVSVVSPVAVHVGGSVCMAQDLLGASGGLNIPTADMHPAGTFRVGINYVDRGMIMGEETTDHRWAFDYYTFNYYVDVTLFDWLEATFRETLLESPHGDHNCYRQQDRSVTIKVRPLREGRWWPAIALGVNDPYSFTGHHIYASGWGVLTKHVPLSTLGCSLGLTAGYMKAFEDARMYDGPVGRVSLSLDWLPECSLSGEYDSQGWNVGVQALLWRHLGLYVFTHEFSQLNAGIRYQTTIRFR